MIRFGIFTLIGDRKVLATMRITLKEANEIASVLTETASSNPRNLSPVHWVEEI